MKRKGQSEIITTILLILIVLAAIAIVWYIVTQLIWNKNPFICSEIRLTINAARSNETPNGNQVEVKRMNGGDNDAVKKVKILINGQSATIQKVNGIDCTIDDDDGDGVADAAGIGDEAKECDEIVDGRTAYSLEQIEVKTYSVPIDTLPRGALVEIAPIIEEDGMEKVCDKQYSEKAI